jgi:phosphonate transport system ATP-binding protein
MTTQQMQPTDEAISLTRIKAYYDEPDKPVLDIERLVVSRGERLALVGPSGSGKTTLLRLINGYVRPATGRLCVMGKQMTRRNTRRRSLRRRVGFVFQSFNLVERATVFENVLWGRLGYTSTVASLFTGFSKEDKRLAVDAIREVNLSAQIGQRCDTLSGGQQQRVALARVLTQEPDIILADEPISSLDPTLADDVLSLLVQVSKARSATLVMSLHQPDLARRYADRLVGLRAGRVVFDDVSGELSEAVIKAIYGRDPAARHEAS